MIANTWGGVIKYTESTQDTQFNKEQQAINLCAEMANAAFLQFLGLAALITSTKQAIYTKPYAR